ncbi:MAG TPA: TonB-dependent receptor [Chitinophagales bacterium]|nr:TonB-dependent receptor [Chitinophagales bacterium]HRK27237.1 TonB-dependent receptor [Chitinophagales bacterium]
MKNALFFVILTFVFAGSILYAQPSITGKVYDASSPDPLVGVTIVVKGTTYGTTTNFNGEFVLAYQESFPVVLVFSYVGYETKEIELFKREPVTVYLMPSTEALKEVTVTSRRRSEEVQDIPLPISVLGAKELDNSGAFNVNRVKELTPSVQMYSSNPRNTTLNIRGVGSTFGLTNDGIDPGVGFYVDGVYFARPAASTLDFIDVQQVEVIRGPQGTLFGKNTTAGTFNITSRKPTFTTTAVFEQSFGNFGFIQTKGSVSGPLVKNKLAARLSFSGTHRDGTIYNVSTDSYTNTMSNQGIRTQLLFTPNEDINITLATDYTRQRPDGYAQVFAGVAPTLRPEFAQFENIITDLNYDLPSRNPFDRIIDHDTPWRSNQDMGGVSVNADFKLGNGTITATSAWRTWTWGPSNDRDFTGLQALRLSQAPSIHHQWSQEIRYAGQFAKKLSGVAGIFLFYQKLDADGAHVEESGKDQWRFVQTNQNPLWQTPGLLDGYGIKTNPSFRNFSGAVFGQIDWNISKRFTLLPGIRLNYDLKEVDFKRQTYGGLQTEDPQLLALQRIVYSNQAFTADIDNWNVSGQLTLNFKAHERARIFATYSLGFKPVGLNLGGLPTENGQPLTDLAIIKPERVSHVELGVKTKPYKNAILNLILFNTDIFNYQTLVRAAELGVNRGYLSNADQVRTMGAELEATYSLPKHLRLNLSVSYTDGKYVSFPNAPVPLEETGGPSLKDISGEILPGISKWAASLGAETYTKTKLLGQEGETFFGFDLFYRSSFSSNPSLSTYLYIDGYALLNARLGFRAAKGVTIFVWSRNVANTDYFEQLLPAAGNIGHYAGVLGDPRTYGITLRYQLF